MDKKEFLEQAKVLKDLLGLEYSPVAVMRKEGENLGPLEEKVRICRAILEAGKGMTLTIDKNNNACFGAAWHLGFHKLNDPRTAGMVRKFVVEGEKLFCSYEALDNLISQMGDTPDNSSAYFKLSPLEESEDKPDLVIFIVDAEASCRLLTLVTFLNGMMPKIKIGGPTCRLTIIYPLLTGEVNLSFYDYTSRKMCNVEKDKLLISIPYRLIPDIINSIDKCSAGRAKIEFPQDFREFLQKRLANKV